ncbi:hypothetical protein L1987_51659 [Smallanthus sonchifolius]|uniref:Uncharacterized protein n=1 Tax=Smallanthus sonchifolius TaxID=185202 RepID=A0ACB9ES28_9ASTR|nr:hypothetical protein L1987_51659 [Smallanthus sonchifolius]
MADRYKGTGQDHLTKQKPTITTHGGAASFRRKRPPTSPESTQLRGLMVLLVATGILLVLSGAAFTTAVIGFILLAPIIIITSPIWVPVGILLLFSVATVLSICGVGVAAAAVLVVQLVIKGGDAR